MIEATETGDEIDALRRVIAAQAAELAAAKAGLMARTLEVEKLKLQIAKLRRMRFGRSSEKLDREIAQLELTLEERSASQAVSEPAPSCDDAAEDASASAERATRRRQRRLPDHLPRTDIVHVPDGVTDPTCACKTCGAKGDWRQVGEDVREVLDYVPGRFQVIRHVRPAYSCRSCESMTQAPMPSLPIERGLPGPGLIAQVLIAKYADHLPLYRQAEIFARDGVEIERSVMAGWVGKVAALVQPLVEAIGAHVMAAERLHADDTPVPVLAPGLGRTKTGRLWVYLRDERPHGGADPPAVIYRYTPDRKGEHPRQHLQGFAGFLQADGYSGFAPLYQARPDGAAPMIEVGCWAHARRHFYDIDAATKSPIAAEALTRIGALFDIERAINGLPPDLRRQNRKARAAPLIADLAQFLDHALAQISSKSELAKAIRYARSRWIALTRFLDDGRIDISNNAAERAIRPLALGRKNYLFAGSDAGGERAAAIYTLIQSARLNERDPAAYLRAVVARIADHPINRVNELMPWNIGKP